MEFLTSQEFHNLSLIAGNFIFSDSQNLKAFFHYSFDVSIEEIFKILKKTRNDIYWLDTMHNLYIWRYVRPTFPGSLCEMYFETEITKVVQKAKCSIK